MNAKESQLRANWEPGNPNDRSVLGFRIRHGSARGPMSKQKYQGLKNKGRGPQEISDGHTIIISVEAEAEWDRKQATPKGALARLVEAEAKARRQRARYAGAKSVEARRTAGLLPPKKKEASKRERQRR